MSLAWRSPWPSQIAPAAIRAMNNAWRPSRYLRTRLTTTSWATGSRTGPTKRAVAVTFASNWPATASLEASAEISADRSAPAWNRASTRATCPSSPSPHVLRCATDQMCQRTLGGHSAHDHAMLEDVAVHNHLGDPEVHIGCQPAVEVNLSTTILGPSGDVGEVDEVEVQRLAQLQHTISQEQQHRDVGLAHDGVTRRGRHCASGPTAPPAPPATTPRRLASQLDIGRSYARCCRAPASWSPCDEARPDPEPGGPSHGPEPPGGLRGASVPRSSRPHWGPLALPHPSGSENNCRR